MANGKPKIGAAMPFPSKVYEKYRPGDQYIPEVDLSPIPYDTPGYPSTPVPIQGLLPTGPVDFIAETLLTGLGQKNPTLAILAGLAGPRAIKAATPATKRAFETLDVKGGDMYSKWRMNKVFREAMEDPDLMGKPLDELSTLVDRAYAKELGFKGRYRPYDARDYWTQAHGLSKAYKSDYIRPIEIKPETLSEAFKRWRRNRLDDIIWHELEHFQQHGRDFGEVFRPGSPLIKQWTGSKEPLTSYKKPITGETIRLYPSEEFGSLGTAIKILKPTRRPIMDIFAPGSPLGNYLLRPIEVEARIASLSRIKNPKRVPRSHQYRQLEAIGYTPRQIQNMMKDYKNLKELRRSKYQEQAKYDMENLMQGNYMEQKGG